MRARSSSTPARPYIGPDKFCPDPHLHHPRHCRSFRKVQFTRTTSPHAFSHSPETLSFLLRRGCGRRRKKFDELIDGVTIARVAHLRIEIGLHRAG